MCMQRTTLTLFIIVLLGAALALYMSMRSGDASMQDDTMHNDDTAMQGDTMMVGDTTHDDTMVGEDAMIQDDTATQNDTMMQADTMAKPGAYEVYSADKLAKANDGTVVLFFRASWCPTCKAADADIRAHLGVIPANVTILDVDYDTHADLKKKYGVTYQHTFVQVDAQGNALKKWSGSPTLAAIVGQAI